ncbi:MAG TPA: hypothetical protein DEQ09_11210, partial [Bacteroidales bacterium]|nr:hypothetical protein [Bacteroidales bacterium]
MNHSTDCRRILIILLLFAAFFGGCKNHAPSITHNLAADTLAISHGDVLDIEIRFADDREELNSATVLFNNKEIYSGKDSLFKYKLQSSLLSAGKYKLIINALDEDSLVSKKLVTINIEGVHPTMGELSVAGIGATYIKAQFNIKSAGGLKIDEKGILFSPVSEQRAVEKKLVIGNTDLKTDDVVEGLPRDTELSIRAYSTNAAGTGYSEYMTITTKDGIPVIRTITVSNIHSKTVDATGTLVTDGGEKLSSYGICYSEGSEPSIKDYVSYAKGKTNFKVELGKLRPFTKYYYRAFAKNRFATRYGTIKDFETTGPPTVITGEPGRIMVSSIRMNINVTDDGGHEVTDAGICYSMLKNPTIDTNVCSFGNGSGEFEKVIENLDPGSKYHLRAYAVNSEGVSYGEEIIMFTKLGIPEVVTEGVTDIDYSSATIKGNVPDDGGLDITERGVVWDTVPRPTRNNNYGLVEGNIGPYDYRISGLESGRRYYARAYAKNEKGFVYAEPVEFVPLINTEMVEVKGNYFSMGSDKGEKNSQPVHQVRLDDYMIGKYEVTNEEFAKFLNYQIDFITFEGDSDIVMLH